MSRLLPITNRGHRWKKGQSGNLKGRPKGAKSKRTIGRLLREAEAKSIEEARAARAERVAQGKKADAAAAELTPLAFMLEVLRHPSEYPFSARQWAAEKAAPYQHKKMPIAIEGTENPLRLLDVTKLAGMSDGELDRLAKLLEEVAPG